MVGLGLRKPGSGMEEGGHDKVLTMPVLERHKSDHNSALHTRPAARVTKPDKIRFWRDWGPTHCTS